MPLSAYDTSAGVFVRGLANVHALLQKAEAHAAAEGGSAAALLGARLDMGGLASAAPTDLHMYTLSAQAHWAAEGARVSTARLLGTPAVPAAHSAQSFAELHRHIDATIAYLQGIAPGDLEASLDRALVIEHPRASIHTSGRQFLLAFAIPHFFYHVTSIYGILRNHGVPLTMGDFLGRWMDELR